MTKLFVDKFSRNNNAFWIIFRKENKKLIKLCSGFYNFEKGWCSILNVTSAFFTYYPEAFEILTDKDWNYFNIKESHKK